MHNYKKKISTKTHVMVTQKNCLYEMVLLSTQNKCLKLFDKKVFTILPGRIAQSVTCLTADPGVANSQSHTVKEIDHEIISMAILLPSADSKRVVDSYI